MIRHHFRYHAPQTLQDAVDAVGGARGETAVIAGGTWVVPEMALARRRPSDVIDLRLIDLAGVSASNGTLVIGPRTTYTQLEAETQAPSLLRTLSAGITGGAQIRNQGTVGGSACYANPASDVPGALVGLDATLRLTSVRGERDVAAADFFQGAFATERQDDELLSAIVLPRPLPGTRYGYVKFKLTEGSWPIVTASCALDSHGAIAALVLGGAAATPIRVDPSSVVSDDLEQLSQTVSDAVLEPWSDALAVGKYRKAISGVIAKRAVQAALADGEKVQS